MLTVKILPEWLTQRVDDAPTSYHRDLPPAAVLRTRMAWQKLQRQAREGDELWAFSSPSGSWKKQSKYSGYALVRDGQIVDTVVVSQD